MLLFIPDGWQTALRFAFRYDATVAASALDAGSRILWSEHLQHGTKLKEGLRILSPFHDSQ